MGFVFVFPLIVTFAITRLLLVVGRPFFCSVLLAGAFFLEMVTGLWGPNMHTAPAQAVQAYMGAVVVLSFLTIYTAYRYEDTLLGTTAIAALGGFLLMWLPGEAESRVIHKIENARVGALQEFVYDGVCYKVPDTWDEYLENHAEFVPKLDRSRANVKFDFAMPSHVDTTAEKVNELAAEHDVTPVRVYRNGTQWLEARRDEPHGKWLRWGVVSCKVAPQKGVLMIYGVEVGAEVPKKRSQEIDGMIASMYRCR